MLPSLLNLKTNKQPKSLTPPKCVPAPADSNERRKLAANNVQLQLEPKPDAAHALTAKLFASNKFRRRSYDDQEGDNDINIILQPSDIADIEKGARAGYARLKAKAAASLAAPDATPAAGATTSAARTIASSELTAAAKFAERHGQQRRQTHKLRAFEGIFEDIKLAKCLLDQDYNQTVRLFIERSALNWNFNSFTFDALCCGKSLTELLLHLFDFYNLYAIFSLDIIKVLKCFRLLEFGYHSTNPYHNSVHAADVTQAMHCFIQENKIRRHMTDLEVLCSILAAVCHDLDHPGVNQSFLVATKNPLASLYKNNSVLENHHWRFALCIFKEAALFDHFEAPVLDDMKQQLKQLILATDIARQNDYLKRFKAMTGSAQFSMSNTDDRALVLQMALKCADLGNPCRPWLISRVWSNLICDEFYRMGQIERRLGVPLTPICQREKTSIAGIQTDFFRFIVLPLLELWHNFLGSPLSDLLMSNFDHNYKRWQRANRIVQQLRRRKSVASLEPVRDVDCDDEREASTNNNDSDEQAANQRQPPCSLFQDALIAREIGAAPGPRPRCGDSFGLVKRASSDYIKSGNGRLELLRDFQLNRIIEKSPVISRTSSRFAGAKRRASRLAANDASIDSGEEPRRTGNWIGAPATVLCGARDVAGRDRRPEADDPPAKIVPVRAQSAAHQPGRPHSTITTTSATITTTAPAANLNAPPSHRHQPLSPIEDHDGPSPDAGQPRPSDKDSTESLSSSPRSQASSTSSSPVMKRSISSRTSIDQQQRLLQQQHKSSTNFSLHESSRFKLSSARQSLSVSRPRASLLTRGHLPPAAGQSLTSMRFPPQPARQHTTKSIYNSRRRESDPGCLTENYELAAAIVLLQYKSSTIFHRRNSFD